MKNLKTWNEVRNMVHDISGIDNPFDYLYSNEITNTKVWYPVVKGGYQDVHKFNKGSVYSHEEIVNYSRNVNVEFQELGEKNYSSGHNFIKLVERKSNKVITFILNKDYQFECVYNDFE